MLCWCVKCLQMMLMYSNLAATLLLLVIPYFVGQYTTMWGLQKLLEQVLNAAAHLHSRNAIDDGFSPYISPTHRPS